MTTAPELQQKTLVPFTAGRSCSQLPALKLDWNQYQQPLRQGCRSALSGSSLPISLTQPRLLHRAVWQTVLPPTTAFLPRGAGSWGAAPLISHSQGGGGGNTKGTHLYLPLSGWNGPSCENSSSSSEPGTIPKQIQQQVPWLPAGLSALLVSRSPS